MSTQVEWSRLEQWTGQASQDAACVVNAGRAGRYVRQAIEPRSQRSAPATSISSGKDTGKFSSSRWFDSSRADHLGGASVAARAWPFAVLSDEVGKQVARG